MAARETYIWDPDLQSVVPKAEFQARERKSKGKTFTARVKHVERGSWIYDRAAKKLVTRDEYHSQVVRRGHIIRDIDAYRTVAADVATGGKAVIGGRRQHREFLKRNGYVEVGNEKPVNRLEYGPKPGEIARDIKRALGE